MKTLNVEQKVLDRIAKLLKLSQDGGATDGEIAAALKQAKAMMAKYDVAERDVLLDDSEAGMKNLWDQMQDVEIDRRATKLRPYDAQLAAFAAWFCDCGCYVSRGYREVKGGKFKGRATLHECVSFYGLPRDVAVATALYREFFFTMRAMSRRYYGPKYATRHHIYMDGFVDGLWSKGHEAKDAQKEEQAVCTAIVVRKSDLCKRYGEEKLHLSGGTYKQQKRKASDYEASRRGYADGRAQDLTTDNKLEA